MSSVTTTPTATAHARGENLALTYQEILTAIVRLRSNRQAVNDAASFRAHMREALKMADAEARKLGYTQEDIRVATFAAVAFLDESILNSRNPVFADWPRKPLQEEMFGGHNAGEIFFNNLDRLLGLADSGALADILEVYYLCLLLGYVGRYSVAGKGDLRSYRDQIGDKIRRIRGTHPDIAPSWRPEASGPTATGDPLLPKLIYTAVGLLALILILFVGYKISLGSGQSELSAIAVRGK